MSTTGAFSSPGIHWRTSMVLALCALVAFGASLIPIRSVAAGSTVGSFEIEGNYVDDSGPGEPIDWSSPPPGLTAFSDVVRRGDDIFARGSKELEPAGWTCVTSSVPPKDDIRSGAVSFRRGFDGKQYLYVHYFRAGVNGDAHMDYEFNQSSAPNPSCPDTRARTDGDIVVTFDTENGGARIFVRAFEWQGNATTGTLVELPLGTQGLLWDGAVNIPNTIPGEEAGSFGEAAINLTDSPVGEVGCGEFGTAYMKTRASTSINAELKDKTPAKAVEGLCPQLELEKSANVGFAVIGDEVTYTLTYRNTGEANATNVTINEPLPAGTAFVSCSDSCTQSADGSSVSWSLGTVAPGASGSVTLTLRITTDQGCEICNVATIDSDQTSPLPSNQVCITIVPEANPAGATAYDSAFGARVTDTLLGLDLTLVPVESSQQGPGSDADSDQLLDVNVPLDGTVLRADVMRTSSRSTVTESPAEATHTSIAETANVDVLDGIVTASAVRGVATANATGTSASYTTIGSAFKDLFVDADGSGPAAPVAFNNVNLGTTVDLSAAFGAGSYVKLYEEIGSNSEPSGSFGGTYAADATVNMIHVHLTDKLPLVIGDQTADVIVAQAVAHADFPQITLCAGRHPRAVSGHAFIASETTDPSLVPVLHGYVSIPSNGGEAHQDLDAVSTSVLTAQSAATDSRGTIDGQSARATSWAEIQDACLLADASGTCTVGASVLRSQSNSLADRDSASSDDDGTLFVQVTVLGVPVTATPSPNTVVELPGIGYVILNEQFCDNGAALPDCSDGSGHAGLTVRAVHLVVTAPSNPTGLQPGAEVILDEAHSDATWIP